MFAADFARRVLREIDDDLAAESARILDGNYNELGQYRCAVERRRTMLAVRARIVAALSPNEKREAGLA